jgi:hypothetical protein
MKKFLILFAVIAAFTSCRKQPDYDTLTYKPIVVTNHDPEAVWGTYNKYYLPGFVGEIGDDPLDSILDAGKSAPILEAIRTNMNARGYKETLIQDSADIGVSVVTITVTTVGTYYPGYWWGYGGYYPYYPYYPYSYTYSYSTGTLIMDFIDLKNADASTGKTQALWTSFCNGVLGVSASDAALAIDAVNQSFVQSPYIQAN